MDGDDTRRFQWMDFIYRNFLFVFSTVVMVIGLMVMYVHRHPQIGDVICPEFFFDRSFVHSTLELLEDGAVVTNTKRHTKISNKNRYYGTTGPFSLPNSEKFMLQIGVMYEITKRIVDSGVVFEIAFVEEKYIEKYKMKLPIEKKLVVMGIKCGDNMCIAIQKHGITFKKIISKTYAEVRYIGIITWLKYGNNFSIYMNDINNTSRLLHKFQSNLSFEKKYWPIYGIRNDNSVRVVLTAMNISNNIVQFDELASHADVYNSDDGRAIANYNVGLTFKRSGAYQQTYRGTVGDLGFKASDNDGDYYLKKPSYFEVNIKFDADLRLFATSDVVFELGLAPKDLLKKHTSLKHHANALIVSVSRCTKLLRLCVTYWQNGSQYRSYQSLGEIERHVNYNITLGFKIDTKVKEVCVYNILTDKKDSLHYFTNVSFSQPLYPVFGMTDKTFVKMRLHTKHFVTQLYGIFGYFQTYLLCDFS